MNTLKVERRNMQTKAKRLRREGFVTGNVFGRELESSIPVQMTRKDAEELIKTSHKGSQVMMELDGKERDVLIKEIDYDATKRQILEIDFQLLVAGEMVHSVAEVVLLNHEKVLEGIIDHNLSEIEYKATPDALVEKVEIDLAGLKPGAEILVKDLPIASDKNIVLHTDVNECVVRIVEPHMAAISDEDDEEEATED